MNRFALLSLLVGALVPTAARGQQMDNPVALPISYYGEGVVSASGDPYSYFSFGSSLGMDSTASGSYLIGGTTVYSPLRTTNILPGKDYTVQVISYNFAVVHVRFAEIPGYNIYLGPTVASTRMSTITLGSNYTFHFRLEAINDLTNSMASMRGGECPSLTEDKAIWFVGLGKLRTGRPAGAVGFRAASITGALYTRSALIYDVVDPEVSLTRDGNGYLTSVTAREAKLVMTTLSGNSYKIDAYSRDSAGNWNASPFVTYTVQQYGSGTAIRIIRSEGTVHWATRLEQSGSTWTLYDWRTSDSAGNFTGTLTDKRTVTNTSSSTNTVNYGITNSVSTPTVVKQKNYTLYSGWGWELTNLTMGPGVAQAPSTSFTYYSTSTGTGWARAIETMTEATGKWTKYDYYNTANDKRGGLTYRIYRPWLNNPSTPGAATTTNCLVETYNYTTNFDGSMTAPLSRVTTANGTTIGQTTWSYSFAYTSANGSTVARMLQTDYANGSSSLTTTNLGFRPDNANSFLRGKPHSVKRPDGTKDSYAYFFGTWDPSTRVFNPNNGSDRLILCLHGQAGNGTGATWISSWTANPSGGSSENWTVDGLYLINNLSTISETVIDTNGRVVLQAENIFNGVSSGGNGNNSSLERISGTAYSFDANNRLAKELDIVRTVPGVEVATNYTYSAGLLSTKTDIDGAQTSHTYDSHLRLSTTTTAATGSGSYPAKTQTFTYNLANLKETAQDCSCSPAVTTYYYETTGRVDWLTEPKPGGGELLTSYTYDSPMQTTITLPTDATKITKMYRDGRLESETGTGQVATYVDYAVGTYIVTKTTRRGGGTEYPWSDKTRDGLGRVIQERTPQVGWTTSLTNKAVRKTYTYSTSTGQLLKMETRDEANSLARLLPDHLYVYTDASGLSRLGMLLREGDDLGSNGSLDASSADRITLYTSTFYKDTPDYNGWIRQDLQQVYRTLNNASDITTVSERRTRFTRFNNGSASGSSAAIADVVELDSSGRWSVTWQLVNPTTRTRRQDFRVQGTDYGSTVWQDGYLKSESSTSGVSKTYAYNSQGLQSSVTHSGTGEVESTTYHPSTKYVESTTRNTGAGGTTTTDFTYSWNTSDNSHTICATDSSGNTTYTEYNAKGLEWRNWGSGAQPTLSAYNGYGQRTHLTTYQGGTSGATWAASSFNTPATTQWVFSEPTGLNTSKIYPGGATVNYSYNARGQLYQRTWARGIVTTHTYDPLTGELTGKTYSDSTPAVGFTYNRFGALASANQSGITNRTFSYRSDLKRDYESLDSYFGSRTLTSTYDASVPGRPTGHSFNGNVTVSTTLGYNSLGQVGSVHGVCGGSSATFSLGYTSATDWVQTISHGSFSRTQTLATSKGILDRVLTQWSGSTRGDFDSAFDSLGRRSQLSRSGSVAFGTNSQTYLYTADQQLEREYNDQDPNNYRYIVYTWDTAGNRDYQWDVGYGATYYAADLTNKYTSITSLHPEANINHDADGNLIQDGTWAYTWDAENRLKTMSRTGQTLTFTYDYMDRRIRKQVTGTDAKDRKYVWDGWKLVAETSGDGFTIQFTFVWGPDFSSATCGGAAGGAGGLLGIYSPGSAMNYAVPDAMGNIVGYLDASGNVNAQFEYSGFGMIRNQSGSMTSLPIGFASQYTDRETALVYYGYRYYNATHGRFISRDPIEEAGGNNLYAFVGNNPTNRWDVLGLTCYVDYWWENSYDWQTETWGIRKVFSWSCVDEFIPFPSLSSGSFERPDWTINQGFGRRWWDFDPRAANSGGYRGDSPADQRSSVFSIGGLLDFLIPVIGKREDDKPFRGEPWKAGCSVQDPPGARGVVTRQGRPILTFYDPFLMVEQWTRPIIQRKCYYKCRDNADDPDGVAVAITVNSGSNIVPSKDCDEMLNEVSDGLGRRGMATVTRPITPKVP